MIKQIKNPIIVILLFLLALLIPRIKGKKKPVDWTEIQKLLKGAFGEECVLFLVDGDYSSRLKSEASRANAQRL